MLAKNKRPHDPGELPPNARLRANVTDIAANQYLSARRVVELAQDVNALEGSCMPDIARVRLSGSHNAHRDLHRIFQKRSQWPHLYWAEIRVLNIATQKEEHQWLAFKLPDEYVSCLHRHGRLDALLEEGGMDPLTRDHLRQCREQSGCANLLAVGLWGDEMPCNWDRSESVAGVNINFPGLTGQWKNLRLPVTALPAKQVGPNTWHDIMGVVGWSFDALATGVSKAQRHDGAVWLTSDKKRNRLNPGRDQRRPVSLRAALCEIRADWQFYAKVLHFPQHNKQSGCCWMCRCTPSQVVLGHFYKGSSSRLLM